MTEASLIECVSSGQGQRWSASLKIPGNPSLGERPPDGDFFNKLPALEEEFNDWTSTFPFKSQNVFIENVRTLHSMLPAHQDDIINMVKEIKQRRPSRHNFGEIVWEGLEGMLKAAKGWGLDINIPSIKQKYEVARNSDERRFVGQLEDPRLDEEEYIQDQEYRVAEMRSTQIQTRGPFSLRGENLLDIQQAILYEIGSSGDMDLPDVWYPKQEHNLTPRNLRWYLIEEDWMITEEYQPVQDSHPELYFVDVTQSDSRSSQTVDYTVVLLHYDRNGKERDEPVPIAWNVPCQTALCRTLGEHLRHLEVTCEWNSFTARHMDNDCGTRVSLIDNRSYPEITRLSVALLNTPLRDHRFRDRHNELYLQCRMQG